MAKGWDSFDNLIKQKGKCCICSKEMKKSKFVSLAQINKKATWQFPIWTNVLVPLCGNRAMAVVCDKCYHAKEKGNDPGPIKFAVEVRGEDVIMHKFEELEDVPTIPEIIALKDLENLPQGEPYLFHGSIDDPRYGFRKCSATHCESDLLVDSCHCILLQGHTGQHECECGNKW